MVPESENCVDGGLRNFHHRLFWEFGNCALQEAKAFRAFVEEARKADRRIAIRANEDRIQGENTARYPPGERPGPVDLQRYHRGVAEGTEAGSGVERPGLRGGEWWAGDSDGVEREWGRELAEEILDDKWVQESRKRGQESGWKSDTGHLEGLNWEVLVVNEPVVHAFCLPGGKIVVFTGFLEHLEQMQRLQLFQ